MRRVSILATLVILAVALGAPANEEPQTMIDWKRFDLAELSSEREASGRPYLEFLRVPSMHLGLYELAAGSRDRQSPHDEDEVYHVIEGRAKIRIAGEVSSVGPGSVIYVRAGVEHRFEDIEQPLKVLVVFT